MNKQELIKRYEDTHATFVSVNGVLEDLRQLDEPQKPVVPKFVEDWYEKNKDSFDYNLWEYLTEWERQEPSDFKNWINDKNTAFETLVNMHKFGYEAEKEKRYRVKMKNMDKEFMMLKFDEVSGSWYLGNDTEYSYTKAAYTRKKLEDAGFGEVFNSPLFEIEEVEE